MRRFFLLLPVALLAACATSISGHPTVQARATDPGYYPAPGGMTRTPRAPALAPAPRVKRPARATSARSSTSAHRSTSAHLSSAAHRSTTAHRSSTAGATGYVRLRGSVEVHLPNCPRVLRAHPDGIIPARKSDGPPCYYCRKAEVVPAHRASHVAAVRRTLPPTPVRSRTPARKARYVRLRGAVEIHLSTCPIVLRAHPDGVVPARKNEGPPCYRCRKSEAVAWSR